MFYKRIVASGDLSLPAGTIFRGARLESVAADSSAIVYDAATQALGSTNSKQMCKLVTTVGTGGAHPQSDQIMFGGSGIKTEKGISVTLVGAGAVVYLYYS